MKRRIASLGNFIFVLVEWFPLFFFSFENPITTFGLNVVWRVKIGPVLIFFLRTEKKKQKIIERFKNIYNNKG